MTIEREFTIGACMSENENESDIVALAKFIADVRAGIAAAKKYPHTGVSEIAAAESYRDKKSSGIIFAETEIELTMKTGLTGAEDAAYAAKQAFIAVSSEIIHKLVTSGWKQVRIYNIHEPEIC